MKILKSTYSGGGCNTTLGLTDSNLFFLCGIWCGDDKASADDVDTIEFYRENPCKYIFGGIGMGYESEQIRVCPEKAFCVIDYEALSEEIAKAYNEFIER